MDARRAKGEASRQLIIDATVRVVAASGLAAVTHRAVAAEAGVSVALTTYHFASLNDLLAATLANLTDGGSARLAQLTERARAGDVALLDACAQFLLEALSTRRNEFITALELRIAATRRPELRERASQHTADFVDVIAVYEPSRTRAQAIFAAVYGYATLAISEGSEPSARAARSFLRNLFRTYQIPSSKPTTTKGH
jgi:DNA-binding transcriptional regulator YbjK